MHREIQEEMCPSYNTCCPTAGLQSTIQPEINKNDSKNLNRNAGSISTSKDSETKQQMYDRNTVEPNFLQSYYMSSDNEEHPAISAFYELLEVRIRNNIKKVKLKIKKLDFLPSVNIVSQ